jgi:CRP/FNR family transcriptional regulator
MSRPSAYKYDKSLMDIFMSNSSEDTDTPRLCRSCEARHNGICGALNNKELKYLSQHTTKKTVSAGTELVGETEATESFANIMGGVVKLSKMMPDGRQQIVGLQFAPDFLGRPFQETSSITAEAATTVKLCAFPRSKLDSMMKETPGVEQRLLRQTLKELDEARQWMLTLGRKTASEKVASFLYMIAAQIDPERDLEDDGPVTFDLPLTRADIADFLGITIETVSRQFTKLRKDSVIQVEQNRHVTVPDIQRLLDETGES